MEEQIYWAPASTTSDLYSQLASKKYREIPRDQIKYVIHIFVLILMLAIFIAPELRKHLDQVNLVMFVRLSGPSLGLQKKWLLKL